MIIELNLYIKGIQQQCAELLVKQLGQHVSGSYIVDTATKYDQPLPASSSSVQTTGSFTQGLK
jgi:hypothetical protein